MPSMPERGGLLLPRVYRHTGRHTGGIWEQVSAVGNLKKGGMPAR